MMSSFGLETRRANSSVMIDSLSVGGVLIDVVVCKGLTSGQKSYPNTHHAGLDVYIARSGGHNISTKDIVGYTGIEGAVVWEWSIEKAQYDTVLFVFAKQLVNPDLYGIQVFNDNDEILADAAFPAPQFAGTLTLGPQADYSYVAVDGYTANVHSCIVNVRPGTDRLVIINMPNSGASDVWYRLLTECVLSTENSAKIEVAVYAKTSNYPLPSVHIYALNQPIQGSESCGLQVRNDMQQLTFDSSVEVLSRRGELTTQYVGYNRTITYTLADGCTGISIPYFREVETIAHTNGDNKYDETVYVGVARRIGNQLTFNIIKDRYRQYATNTEGRQQIGGYFIRYTPVVDVTQLSPSNIAGTTTTPLYVYPEVSDIPFKYGKVGDVIEYSASISGYPAPALQWYKNGNPIPGANTFVYRFTAQQSDDTSTFQLVATNYLGVARSAITTFYIDTSTPPNLVSASGAGTYHAGDDVHVVVQGGGNPLPTVRLYQGTTKIAEGTPTADYHFTMMALPYGSDTGYRIDYEISNEGEHVGNVVTGQLFFYSYEYSNFTPVTVVTGPASQTVTAGDQVSISCSGNGSTPQSYTWYKNGSQYGPTNNSNGISFTATNEDNGSTWQCKVTNGAGVDSGNGEYVAWSGTATLTVNQVTAPPSVITTQPQDVTTSRSYDSLSNATMTCNANNATSYTWYLMVDGKPDAPFATPSSGTGTPTIQVDTQTMYPGGKSYYYCDVGGPGGVVRSRVATLTVIDNGPPAQLPVFSQQPTDCYIHAGENASFSCAASPVTSYQWYKNNALISGETGPSIWLPNQGLGEDLCQYKCEAFNGSASKMSNIGIIHVAPSQTYPVFSQQPTDCYITASQDASFSCAASPVDSYQWYQNNALMSGQTGSSLYLPARDTGWDLVQFYCVATYQGRSTESSRAVLHVAPSQAPSTYPSYNYPLDTYLEDYGSVSWSASGNYTDSGYWANGSGDASLYDIIATKVSGTSSSGSSSFGVGYNMGNGAGWSCASTLKVTRTLSFNWQIIHRSSGTVVSYGHVDMTAYSSEGVQP